jgi:signal transduction histidine kinase
VRPAVAHVSQETDGKEIAFVTDLALDGASLYADSRAITQIVVNLMANAVKFTPSGGRIALKAVAGAEGLSLVVRDNGRGMAPETVERCFEPFYQGSDKDVSRKREGTGLGLAISRRMAEMHGGTIHLESRLGAGTAVTLWLPPERLQWPDPSLRQG